MSVRMRGALGSLTLVFVLIGAAGEARGRDDTQTIYQYVDKGGRTVFVNGIASVPPELRKTAKVVDLSKVDDNGKLGSEMGKATEKQYEDLLRARAAQDRESAVKDGVMLPQTSAVDPACLETKESEDPWWKRWPRDYPHVLVVLGLVLALLVATPFANRSVGEDKWAKVLGWAVPLLLALGAIVHVTLMVTKVGRFARSAASAECAPGAPSRR